MKRNILLAICLLAGICLGRAFEVNGIHYTIIDGEAVVINENLENKIDKIEYWGTTSNLPYPCVSTYKGNIVIPATVDYEGNTYQVTGIAQGAFCGAQETISLTIPEGIKHIGHSAFYGNKGFKTLEFPKSVERIGIYACVLMYGLERVVLPEKLDTIPMGMFQMPSPGGTSPTLEEVVMPKSCKVIGENAFQGNTKLETLTLPDDLVEIQAGAFSLCKKLKTALPASVKNVGRQAFYFVPSPTNQVLSENILLEPSSFAYAKGWVNVCIPEHITTIPDHCFDACTNIETLEFSSAMDTIGDHSFHGAKKLRVIILPESLKYMGGGAFSRCENLRTVYARMKTPPSLTYKEFGSYDDCPNPDDAVVYVPVGCKEAYKQAGWDKFFAEIIEMSETEQKAAFDEIATGISTVKAGAKARAESWYDLQGRQVTRPEKGRIYIHDGRKVVK